MGVKNWGRPAGGMAGVEPDLIDDRPLKKLFQPSLKVPLPINRSLLGKRDYRKVMYVKEGTRWGAGFRW